MQKKKILFIVEAMGGGVFTYIVDLTNELVEQYNVVIAYAVRPQTPHDFQTYFDSRIHLIKIKNFERKINPIKDFKAFVEIKQVAKNQQPDIIHLHSSKAGILGRWAFNGKKIPLFYTPHGYSFLMKGEGRLKLLFYRLIEKMSAYRDCMIISCSEGEYRESLKLTSNATYISNGINIEKIDKFIETLPKKNKNKISVFTLGRICYQKNPELFNEIATKLPDIHFIWIGDGELRKELTASNIEIIGWINRNEALKKALDSDIFILTSLWEGLPISLLEAMYMKKLCIVSDVIGNNNVIHTGINGYICQTCRDFVRIIKNYQIQNVSGILEQGYLDIKNTYNTKKMALSYIDLYESKQKNDL